MESSTTGPRLLGLIAGPTVLLVLWEVAARSHLSHGLIPTTADVWEAAHTSRTLWQDCATTFTEASCGMVLGSALGILIGVGIVRFPLLRSSVYPLLLAFKAVPLVAFSYLFVIWFGNGLLGKVIMCVSICFIPMTVALVEGVRHIPNAWYRLFRVYRASPSRQLLKLEFPATIPSLLDALKLTSSLSVVGALVGEMAGSESGLGTFLVRAFNQTDLPSQFVVIIATSAIALVLYGAAAGIQTVVSPRFLADPFEVDLLPDAVGHPEE